MPEKSVNFLFFFEAWCMGDLLPHNEIVTWKGSSSFYMTYSGTLTGHLKWTPNFLPFAGYPLPAVQFLGVPADNSVQCLPQSDLGGHAGFRHCCQAGLRSQDITSIECCGWVHWGVLCSTKTHAYLVSLNVICAFIDRLLVLGCCPA